MEEHFSGFRVEGSWDEVVEFADRISEGLEQAGVRGKTAGDDLAACYEAWKAWRPREGDVLEEDVRERTAEEASVSESAGEAADVGVREDVKDAGRKLGEAGEALDEEGLGEAASTVGESLEHAARAADQAWRRALRAVEESLYENVMTRISPYYFDNPLVSANLERLGEDSFAFEVQVKDRTLRRALREHLELDEDG